MRATLQDELTSELLGIGSLARDAMEFATRALIEADLELAERVIINDAEIDRRRRCCEDRACKLLVRHAPLAGDLRAVITTIKAAAKIERMGDLARHVAELARLRHPSPVLPAALVPPFTAMGRLAVDSARCMQRALAERSGACLIEQECIDDAVDELHRTVLEEINRADPEYPVQAGVDVALLARYLERFADQAVGVAKQLDFAVTGRVPAGAHHG